MREFLGLSDGAAATAPKPSPIPPTHLDKLDMLMSWLYGQEQKGEPALIQSQNPNLNQLAKVLANPEARLMLISTRDLKAAFERVEPPSQRFGESLMLASKQAEETMALAGAFDGNPTLMRVAEGLQKTTRSLVAAMKDHGDGTPED